jgi:hypothetical protein
MTEIRDRVWRPELRLGHMSRFEKIKTLIRDRRLRNNDDAPVTWVDVADELLDVYEAHNGQK